MARIGAYVEAARSLTREAFQAAHPDAVLVVSRQPAASGGVTLVTTGKKVELVPCEVLPLRPRAGQARSLVTIGRHASNDVVVAAAEVSKHHAYVSFGQDGAPVIADAGSTNGTTVAGRLLAPREPCPLRSGDVVLLGDQPATFHTSATLYELLRGPQFGP